MPGRFTVPQFIDAEDKILGPLSVRQFIILIIAVLMCFLSWKLADIAMAALLIALWGGLGLVFAFVKINGQLFHVFLLNFVQTFRKPRLRIWHKDYTNEELQFYASNQPPEVKEKKQGRKQIQRGRLSELSLLVNTGGAYNPEEYE